MTTRERRSEGRCIGSTHATGDRIDPYRQAQDGALAPPATPRLVARFELRDMEASTSVEWAVCAFCKRFARCRRWFGQWRCDRCRS